MTTPDPNLQPPKPSKTDFLKRLTDTEIVRRTKHWSPVILRGSLWIGIATLTDFRNSIKELVKHGSMSGVDWMDACVGATLAGMIAWRLFLDQSMSRFHEDTAKKPPI